MGRKERPIASSNRALVRLVRWLRDQRSDSGCSYAELAARVDLHPTTLQRAASGQSVPSERSVRAYAIACGASVDTAMDLWRQARRGRLRSAGPAAPSPQDIDGVEMLRAGLRELYELAGRPSVRVMEERAGAGRLPHSTAHRILLGRTVPRDAHQLTGFLTACLVASSEHPAWVAAWQRARGKQQDTAPSPVPLQTRVSQGPARLTAPVRPAVPASGLYAAVLGPVRLWQEGEPLSTGSPQQRALLAALVLREGRTATAAELIDALWGDEPPSQALAAVRTYASRLRKMMEPGTLVSESGGYAIRLPPQACDMTMAAQLTRQAEQLRIQGDLERARTLLGHALGLWEGEPLAGVPGPYAETQRVRLEEWRLQLLETRLDMDLACGLHADVVAELIALTSAHPLRERLRELLMLALYRGGRQAEALAVYADVRRLLADELGVDPQEGLARLQERILRADPQLAVEAASHTTDAQAVSFVRPAQLPPTVPDFVGRSDALAELTGALAAASAGESLPVVAVCGPGGVGKTALAVQAGHAVAQFFPDGHLYLDLRRTTPDAALAAALQALGVAETVIPAGLTERSALYRSALHGRRVLVVLDHAEDAAQVQWLLPAARGCAVLVTSRRRMIDLAGAQLVQLDVMSPAEALQLFTRIVGHPRVGDGEHGSARYVISACGFLPLAIRAAACRLVARQSWTVSDLADKLADEDGRLDELRAGNVAVKPVIEDSYRALSAEQADSFRTLSSSADSFLSLRQAACLLGRSIADAERLSEGLVDAGLLTSIGGEAYQVPLLAWLYARALP
ncbi:BTAD domain-containing putative transcriptional regulator [Streptomyces sp. NPDC057376]|uniref:AfsR/SARP family transcriptional regulator n=1 Tax=Streptomyces sp. NPDC057376 TaxID=3346110 RepID=UPI002378BF40|nr:AfsR/SARP family transcriptional regulator [Streptomyces sp. CB02414]